MFLFPEAQIIFQNDSGRYLINQCFILPSLLSQPTVTHCLMGQHRRVALIVIVYRNLWVGFTPAIDKLLHPLQVFTRFTIGLTRFANNNTFHFLALDITLQPVEQFRRRNSRQPSCNNLQRIGDCQTCTLATVVDRKNPRQCVIVRYKATRRRPSGCI